MIEPWISMWCVLPVFPRPYSRVRKSSAREVVPIKLTTSAGEYETPQLLLFLRLTFRVSSPFDSILDIAEGPEVPEDQTRLGRFKKSLSRFRERIPNMRYLGFQRNQKGQAWIAGERSQAGDMQRNEPADSDAANNPGNSKCGRMWTSIKNSCRYENTFSRLFYSRFYLQLHVEKKMIEV